ncbi:glyoxalase [Mycobacterium heckeshornense]|nr:glyoxalase [Mycobacterium heckeshornense]MCV7035035.1 VOC family protein [Mycobacterium heckeshornense]PIJ33308.1 glyoxalase [Mycobacterium heckeshornense]
MVIAMCTTGLRHARQTTRADVAACSDNADAATRRQLSFLLGGVIYGLGGALIGLRPVADDTFDENRVGLDHITFQTASKAELDGAATHLDQLGIHHEPVKDIGPSYILEFRGPDNIALELTAPK